MRVLLAAVGRARRAPEAALVDDYLRRFAQAGRPLGLGPAELREVEDKRGGGRDAEAALLLAAAGDDPVVALDERGDMLDSPGFARLLAEARDGGARRMTLAIGGADGHGAALLARAEHTLSLGPMVWPHLLARVMAAEQLYRAASILAGAPYHRI